MWQHNLIKFDGKVPFITTWMKHKKNNQVRINLEWFTQKAKTQKGKADPPF